MRLPTPPSSDPQVAPECSERPEQEEEHEGDEKDAPPSDPFSMPESEPVHPPPAVASPGDGWTFSLSPPRRRGLHQPAVRTAPAARKTPTPAPAAPSATHSGPSEDHLWHCPDGANCSDWDCIMMHPCPGCACGHYGKTWLTFDQFKYNEHKRFKTCISLSLLSKGWNAVNNPVNNGKTKQRAYEDNMARIGKMSKGEKPITPEDADTKAGALSRTTHEELGGKSIQEAAEEDKTALYFGYTARLREQEHLSFLTTRSNGRTSPVLTWLDDGTISAGQATGELGFDSVELYSSTLKVNARAVEAALQRRFAHLPLGVRLWRQNDMGAKYDKPRDRDKVHKVFLTFSRKARRAIRKGKIVVNQ